MWTYGLLGPLEVRRDGRLMPIRAAKQRSLLASLLLEINRVILVDELIGRLWGPAPPVHARASVHNYVMRLRRAFTEAGGAPPIVTRGDGYLIEAPAEAVDVHRFRALVREAKRAEASGQYETASRLVRDALGLWRGEPLLDVPSDQLHQIVAPALAEERLAATELRIGADLFLGRHEDVATELAELTARYPLREGFWAQRILALYRAGRQAEALASYHRLSEILAEELGTDPSQQLRDLHKAVLVNDGSLAAPPDGKRRPSEGAITTRGRPNDLPCDLPDFSGRTGELKHLLAGFRAQDAADPATGIAAIDGMAGIGKTALAIHAAHRLADSYPDGQLFIDLHAHAPGCQPMGTAAALASLLRALGVPGEQIPVEEEERAGMWRAELARRRALIVLDNADCSAQVRPLLPGSACCLTLITSRRRLIDLETTTTLTLEPLVPDDALALFQGIVGENRVAADPAGTWEVLRLCGYLPLAIRIAAARLRSRPAWSVTRMAELLGTRMRLLPELSIGSRSVTASFALSYQHLTGSQQRVFRLLGLLPCAEFDAGIASALARANHEETRKLLEDLVDAHLLEEPATGRYRFHSLLREYARSTAYSVNPET